MVTLTKSTDLITPCLTPEQVSRLESDIKELCVFGQAGYNYVRIRIYFKTTRIIGDNYCYIDIDNSIQLPLLTALGYLSRFKNNFVTKLFV